MEGLLAALGIYALVVAIVWLIIFIGAISAIVAASRSGDVLRRIKQLEDNFGQLERFLRADAVWRRRASPHPQEQDSEPGDLEPPPAGNLWETSLRERGQKECPQCHNLVQSDEPACVCGHRWTT